MTKNNVTVFGASNFSRAQLAYKKSCFCAIVLNNIKMF